MQIKTIATLILSILSFFYLVPAKANGCNDFSVFIDNHTKESLYVVTYTPNNSKKEKPLEPGGNYLDLSINSDNAHSDTWEIVQVYKADKKTLIFSGNVNKNKLSRWTTQPCEGMPIYQTGNLLHDANYTMKGHMDRPGYCNQDFGF